MGPALYCPILFIIHVPHIEEVLQRCSYICSKIFYTLAHLFDLGWLSRKFCVPTAEADDSIEIPAGETKEELIGENVTVVATEIEGTQGGVKFSGVEGAGVDQVHFTRCCDPLRFRGYQGGVSWLLHRVLMRFSQSEKIR